jgi:hypothetical protein
VVQPHRDRPQDESGRDVDEDRKEWTNAWSGAVEPLRGPSRGAMSVVVSWVRLCSVVSRLGDLPGPILIHGRVAWRLQHPFNGHYLVGLEFTEFENVTREERLRKIEDWRSCS